MVVDEFGNVFIQVDGFPSGGQFWVDVGTRFGMVTPQIFEQQNCGEGRKCSVYLENLKPPQICPM